MRRRLLLIFAVLAAPVAAALMPAAPAQAFCDTSEGCSPCPGPTLVVDGKNTRLEWVYC